MSTTIPMGTGVEHLPGNDRDERHSANRGNVHSPMMRRIATRQDRMPTILACFRMLKSVVLKRTVSATAIEKIATSKKRSVNIPNFFQ